MFQKLLSFPLNNTSAGFIHLRITTVPNYSPMLPCLPLKIERVFGYARISLDEAIGLLLQDRRRIGPSGHTHTHTHNIVHRYASTGMNIESD